MADSVQNQSITPRIYDRTSFILVVDDDDSILKFFKIHLNKFFSKVIVATTAKDAIATLKEKEIDLVMTDVRMPRMDGIKLMKRVRAFDPTIPVYLISGGTLDDYEAEVQKLGVDGFLKKPFTIDELDAFIEQGMQRREGLKALGTLVEDKKVVADLLKGKFNNNFFKDEESRARAEGILSDLRRAS